MPCPQGAEYPGTSGFVYVIQAVEKCLVKNDKNVVKCLELPELTSEEQVKTYAQYTVPVQIL
jgi:hypothetical protein